MYIPTDFKPAWWAKNPHMQTILADYLTRTNKAFGYEERLELDDGDFLDLVWSRKLENDYCGPILVLFHGLEGSVNSHYAYRLLTSFDALDWPCVIMHFRGCSGEPNRLPRAYHSGETSDARFFLQYLTKRFANSDLFAVGYSLGGNMLLKYLGEYQCNSLLKGAASVSPPLNLSACEERLKSGFSRVYQHHLLSRMKSNLKKKIQQIPGLVDQLLCDEDLKSITNFKIFDHQVTAPLHGFSSADDYYEKNSALQYLIEIEVPCLILHAKDDPFMTYDVIPKEEQLADCVDYELSEYGGHVGFIGGYAPWRPQFYLEKRLAKFFIGLYKN